MSDVADILGNEKVQLSASDEAARLFADKSKSKPKATKPKGMSRELFSLVGTESIAPAVQTDTIVFKNRRQSAQGKWVWAKFTNSARTDGKAFYHWVKADLQQAEYPYAKFNTRLEPVAYTDEEYEKFLTSPQWTRSETDHLMYICAEYDLRWPVIVDRYTPTPPRTTEELMGRFYFVSSKIKAVRTGMNDFTVKNSNTSVFDFEYERLRRVQQEALYRRTPEEDAEEIRLKEELKNVDAALKRLKKMNKLPKATSTSSKSPPPITMTYNTPSVGTPCLQSARLVGADRVQTGLAKSTVKKVCMMMKELGVPDKLLATKDICDTYENIQRDIVSLLSLHNTIAKKEKDLHGVKQSLGVSKRSQVVVPHAKLLVKEVEVPYVDKTPLPESSTASVVQAPSAAQYIPSGSTTKKSSSHKRKSSEMKASASLPGGIASIQPVVSNSTTSGATSNKPPAKRKK